MLTRRYSFLRISLILYITLFTLINCSGNDQMLWGRKLPEIRLLINRADFSFLRHIDFEKEKLSEVLKLGREAPYYFHFIFKELGLRSIAGDMAQLAWKRGRGYLKEEAGLLLLAEAAGQEEYQFLEELAGKYLTLFEGFKHIYQAKRFLVEALYWQQRDEEVLELLEELKTFDSLAYGADQELLLFQAVSSCRLALAGWEDLFISLISIAPASSIHQRALSFLRLKNRQLKFSPEIFSLLQTRVLLYSGKEKEAVDILMEKLSAIDPEVLKDLFPELSNAYFAANRLRQGFEFFLGIAAKLTGESRLGALEMAARLLRKAGDHNQAAAMLAEVVELSSESSRKDRAIWYLLDMSLAKSPGRILAVLSQYAPLWQQGDYFDDILGKLISRWVAGRNWINLSGLYRSLNHVASGNIQARLAFILARAQTYGYLPSDPGVKERVELLEEAAARNPAGYYGMIAAVLLGKGTIVGLKPAEQEKKDSLLEDSLSGPEELAAGFFRFGLPLYGYRIVRKHRDSFSPANILGAAEELNRAGLFLESIRLMNLYKSRLESMGWSILTPQAYQFLYPTAFITDIAELSRSEGFPAAVFLALVREESHFDANIVSRTGAVGLAQLMAPTANDMARLLKIKNPDLRDPHTNLVLGAEHFGRLLKRLKSIPKALLAYNAGLSRLRRWERAFGDLPIELLIEALPYQESRHYLRKILVSSIYYSYLHRGVSPEETVRLFFPEAFKE